MIINSYSSKVYAAICNRFGLHTFSYNSIDLGFDLGCLDQPVVFYTYHDQAVLQKFSRFFL